MTPLVHMDPEQRDELPASWEELLGSLLRGFVHSLNNRVAALRAFTDLATMDESPLDVNSVRAEIDRIHALTLLIGRLAARSDIPEALEVLPVLEVAIEMHDHHAGASHRKTEITHSHAVHPVRVPRSALLRLLLLIIDGCRSRPATTLAIEVGGSADVVVLSFRECQVDTRQMDGLAASCGAIIDIENGHVNVTLPSLLALRRLPNPS